MDRKKQDRCGPILFLSYSIFTILRLLQLQHEIQMAELLIERL